ncbi:putative major facilitator superfamily [Lupinus albus]|uniref:Putative major facilitator superfamily n=1 Tax=Lupinus albus TaxID=3870 RepID=A0A6A4NEK6_LUPAL|nr:putative major facilitator superfamily [Lupinus albus]
MKAEKVTLVLVNLAGIMEKADESLLPGVYKEVGEALHTDPTGLGSLTLFRSMVQSASYPLAAYLAHRHNRAHVIALGAFLWAAATFLVAFSNTFFQMAASRALNGIGLALVTPAIQSLVADSTDDNNRGTAFGWLQLTGNIGSIVGGLFSLLIAPLTFMGIPGWRLSFHIVGLISVVVGSLVYLFAKDPHFSDKDTNANSKVSGKTFRSEVKNMVQEAKSVSKIVSFQIIVAQGVTGSFPWSALSFAPMWLELSGYSHQKTAFLIALFVIASSLGSLFGGKMGDLLSTRLPNSGRIILAQISSGSAIPLAAILLLGLSDDPSSVIPHALVLIIMGFFISWNAPATNNPIFAEIVPERARTSVYALDRSFESILSSFAPPAVGILAQHVYGFKPIPEGSTVSQEILTDRENAASLAKALYSAIGIPMALCCFIYSFLYHAYPRDRDRARMEALVESEMQQLESEVLTKDRGFDSEDLFDRDYDGDAGLVNEDNTLLRRS